MQQEESRSAEAIPRAGTVKIPTPDFPSTAMSPALVKALEHYNAGRFLRVIEVLSPLVGPASDSLAELHLMARSWSEVDPEKAVPYLKRLVTLSPGNTELLHKLGECYERLKQDELAQAYFELGLDMAPDDRHCLSALFALAESRNDLPAARNWLNRLLEVDRASAATRLAEARMLRREGKVDDAITAARAALNEPDCEETARKAGYLLGKMLDRQGRCDEAFEAVASANASRLSEQPYRRRHSEAFIGLCRDTLSKLDTVDWDEVNKPLPPCPYTIVWQVGFPRSGTTLLNEIIDAHPGATVLEERNFVEATVARLRQLGSGYPTSLGEITTEAALDLRQRYLDDLAAQTGELVPGHVYVDKNPLSILHLGVAQRIFPEAKILISLRHPADVLLSCLMQNFTMNPSTVCFLSGEGTTGLYCAAMDLYRRYEEILSLQMMEVCYEDLVDDLETHAHRILDFLGLTWDESVLAFHEHARSRRVRTASYDQVTQPLYSRAVARWWRYREHLSPWLAALEPHAQRFGYTITHGAQAGESSTILAPIESSNQISAQSG